MANVLIIGGGAREHALGWKLKQSRSTRNLYFAPGNAGTSALGENVDLPSEPVNTKNADAIERFIRKRGVDLTVIGPEDPIAQGLGDRLARAGHAVFAPSAEAARLESDKAWAKDLMRAAKVPTAESRTFDSSEQALAYVASQPPPIVVKAAGLAAGKGVTVCETTEEAEAAVRAAMVERAFGAAGERVVIEQRLTGQEASVMALVDGDNLFLLEPAQDHKPVHEGDRGPNTGGMGAYSPTPVVDESDLAAIQGQILVPTIDAMRRSECPFRGVLYAGLMMTPGGPKVLEYNARFGDPEIQPLMMRLKGDLYQILRATVAEDGPRLDAVDLGWDPRPACCVVLASAGYPGPYEKGKPITGIEEAERDEDVRVFHAGTRWEGESLVTAGGRVLSVCALGDDLADARDKANAAAERIRFEGKHFRRDIGARVLSENAG